MIAALVLAASLGGGPTAATADTPSLEGFARDVAVARARVGAGGRPLTAEEAEALRAAAPAAGPVLAGELETALGAPDAREQDRQLRRLEARARALAGVERTTAVGELHSGPEPRAALRAVLARREFARGVARKPGESSLPDTWLGLLERWRRWLESARMAGAHELGGPRLGGGLLWLLLGALLVVLVVAALGALGSRAEQGDVARRAGGETGTGAGGAAAEALSRDPDEWRALAERHRAAGETGAAFRALYLSLLSGLHRGGVLELRVARTNWEHARALARRLPAAATPFRELTGLFDRVIYGRRIASGEDWARAGELEGAVRETMVAAQPVEAGPASAASGRGRSSS